MKIILILIILFSLLGCSQVRQFTLDMSKESVENAKAERQIADDLISSWSLKSGIATCGAAEDVEASTMKDIKKLDSIVRRVGKWSDDDFQRGCFLGIQLRMTAKEIKKYVEKIISMAAKYGM